MDDGSKITQLLEAKDVAPQLKVYILGNLMMVLDHGQDHQAEIWATQMLVLDEVLELSMNHPELAAKWLADLRKYGPDQEDDVKRQMDYIANSNDRDFLAASMEYIRMVRRGEGDVENQPGIHPSPRPS